MITCYTNCFAVRLITESDRIRRNCWIGPCFSIFVFVLSSFFLQSGRFGFKGGSFWPEFRGKSFRPGVFIWEMGLRYRVELTLILL